MGIPISSNCDMRLARNWSKSQRAFLSFYCAPKFRALSKFCGKTKIYRDHMETNFNFWGGTLVTSNSEESKNEKSDPSASKPASFVALRSSLDETNLYFRAALKKIREQVPTEDLESKQPSLIANVFEMGSKMIQRGYNAIKNPKTERNTDWYNKQVNEMGQMYWEYIKNIKPYDGFDTLNVMDSWSIKKMQSLAVYSRKIEDDTRKIANKIEAIIESAEADKGIGVLCFDIRVYNKEMFFETKRFEGTPDNILNDQSEDGDEETLMNTLLGFQTHQAILDGSTWYERHVTNLFDLLAMYREKIKPYPYFVDISALQEWSREKLAPVRAIKEKIEKEAETTRNEVLKILSKASRNGVKCLDIHVRVVSAKGKSATLRFKGPPQSLMSDDGLMIEDAITNCDTYSFLRDHSKALNADESSILFGENGAFPERTKSLGASEEVKNSTSTENI